MIIKNNPKEQLLHQLENLYYGGVSESDIDCIDQTYPIVIDRLDTCFSFIKNKYYHEDDQNLFDSLHVVQWGMFLYQISRQIKEQYKDNLTLCDKIYGISKCYLSADLYYEIELPDIWFTDHPQGSVLGRAKYSNYFSFSQSCSVGNNKGKYPIFEEYVIMMSGSKVLGNCNVGNHVIFSANSYIIDQDIPPYSIVFGMGRNAIVKRIDQDKFNDLTKTIF